MIGVETQTTGSNAGQTIVTRLYTVMIPYTWRVDHITIVGHQTEKEKKIDDTRTRMYDTMLEGATVNKPRGLSAATSLT